MSTKPQTTITVGPTPVGGYPSTHVEAKETKVEMKSLAAQHGVIFIVVLVIAFLVFYLLKPSIVMKREGIRILEEVDFVRVLIASVIVALVITALIWVFRSFVAKP